MSYKRHITSASCCSLLLLLLMACSSSDHVTESQNSVPKLVVSSDYLVEENTLTVTTLQATDEDGDSITYSISGVDSALFAVNSATGLLRFLSAPDHEQPQDHDQDNKYIIMATASDGKASTSQVVSIFVKATGASVHEPFHMPTMMNASSLDVEVLEDWHVDTIDGTSRQKLISIHVDQWWDGVNIRVPVRLIVPLQNPAMGFVIGGRGVAPSADIELDYTSGTLVAIEGGAGVVIPMISGLANYPQLPSTEILREKFMLTLDYRYTEFFLWSAILMRSITAAFDDDLFLPGPVIAHGNSKNGIAPLISSIHDRRITAVRSTHAFIALSPIRANNAEAIAQVAEADQDFDNAKISGLVPGDQPWKYYEKGSRSNIEFMELIQAAGWTENEIQDGLDRVTDDLYVSENWEQLMERGVNIFRLPGSHDWVAYDVPSISSILPSLRTYIVPNGGHDRPGHPEAPNNSINAAFFSEQLFGAARGLETPIIATANKGEYLEVTVTFPMGDIPEDSRIFWMFDRHPDGSSWYLYDLFPEENWAIMTGSGTTWTAIIPLDSTHKTIDLITTHTVNIGDYTMPISAPYTRVNLK